MDEIKLLERSLIRGLFIKSAGSLEWLDLFIQGPECRELFIKSVMDLREQEIKSTGCCFAPEGVIKTDLLLALIFQLASPLRIA